MLGVRGTVKCPFLTSFCLVLSLKSVMRPIYYIIDDLSDDRDIYRQCRMMYAQANMLIRKFSMYSVPVKTTLFKTYCTHMHTAHLWRRYRRSSMQKLTVAYNDGMRLLLKVP